MKENTISILAYTGIVATSLALAFGLASGKLMAPHETIAVDPIAHEITQKREKSLGAIYYANVHTVTTVWHLDKGTKTTTDADLSAGGFTINESSKTETTAIQPGELAGLAEKSTAAAMLIGSLNLK